MPEKCCSSEVVLILAQWQENILIKKIRKLTGQAKSTIIKFHN